MHESHQNKTSDQFERRFLERISRLELLLMRVGLLILFIAGLVKIIKSIFDL